MFRHVSGVDRVRRVLRRALQRRGDHRLHLGVGHRARPAGARIIGQPVKTLTGKAPPPLARYRTGDPQMLGDLGVLRTPSAAARTISDLIARAWALLRRRPGLQLLARLVAQNHGYRSRIRHVSSLPLTARELLHQDASRQPAAETRP